VIFDLAPTVIHPAVLIPFLITVALVELTPGPNMAYLGLVSTRLGRAAGLATVAGVTLGLSVYMLASVAGLAEVAAAQPWAYHALRWAGVGYLVWLAYDTWRVEAPAMAPDGAAKRTLGRLLFRGFLTNVLNPKNAVFYVSLLPSFTRPERGGVALQSLTLGCIHLTVALIIHLAIVLGASAARPTVVSEAGTRRMRNVFAVGLLAVAAWVAWSTRSGQ
jgi:threonine/homoserine/homoserine lactone efflux protein